MSSRDLELTLDKQSFEYPALVREAIIKKNWHATAHQTEIVTSCASLNEKYCWFQSRNEIYIWERNKTPHRGTIQLPLPTSGLPRSAKCAVVYDNPHNGSNARFPTPGVLTVSPEGILRHWISTESQNYVEKQLDIDSEVAMAVELGDAPDDDKSASFFLYTTSGSIFLLIGEGADAWKTGALQCYKLFGRRDQGFKPRFPSSLHSNQTDEGLTTVLNTFKYVTEDVTLIISIAPNSLSVFHVDNQSPLWTLKLEDFFQPKIAGCFKEDLQREANLVRAKLIDVAVFRGGLLVLVGGVHEESTRIHLFALWLGPEWIFQKPEKTRFHAIIQITEHKSLFMKENDQIYSNLSLCIPKMTSEATSAERTDGILIIHPLFAMTLYFPFNLEKPESNKTLVRYASYPKKEQLIGYAICEQYVYVMMLDTGIHTLRLLHSGFADHNKNNKKLMNAFADAKRLRDASFRSLEDFFDKKDPKIDDLKSMERNDIQKVSEVEVTVVLLWLDKIHPFCQLPKADKKYLTERYTLRKISLDLIHSTAKYPECLVRKQLVANNGKLVPVKLDNLKIRENTDQQIAASKAVHDRFFGQFWIDVIDPFIKANLYPEEILFVDSWLLWCVGNDGPLSDETRNLMINERELARKELLKWYKDNGKEQRIKELFEIIDGIEENCKHNYEDFQKSQMEQFPDVVFNWFMSLSFYPKQKDIKLKCRCDSECKLSFVKRYGLQRHLERGIHKNDAQRLIKKWIDEDIARNVPVPNDFLK